jgi:predicted DNA-binding ribbon-helix-helix protein
MPTQTEKTVVSTYKINILSNRRSVSISIFFFDLIDAIAKMNNMGFAKPTKISVIR